MANLKNITDVPVVESAEGLNLIVNDNKTTDYSQQTTDLNKKHRVSESQRLGDSVTR